MSPIGVHDLLYRIPGVSGTVDFELRQPELLHQIVHTSRMDRRRQFALNLAILSFFACAIALSAQQLTKRLILKDGNYQPATQWQVKGDRVRYYSAERSEWEEIPTSMIDWAATEKFNHDLETGAATAVGIGSQHPSSEDEAEQKAERSKQPEVAPGLKLPDADGVYLLDFYRQKPSLVEVTQSGGELNKNMTRNILRAAIDPIATSKQSIEIKGPRAQVQAHETRLALYVQVGQGDDEVTDDKGQTKPAPPLASRYRIVRAEKKKDSRVVGNLKIAFYGKVSQQGNWVPTKVEPVTADWARVTPEKPLAPGEYALVEMLGGNQMNLYVWDFGVDPAAPENPPTWTAVQPKSPGASQTPALESRPH